MVGQQFIALLANHPWFKVDVARRQRAVGGQDVPRRGRLAAAAPLPDDVAGLTVERPRPAARRSSCSPPSIVGRRRHRSAFADAGHIVVSNSRNYRMDPTVPLLIPEVNADHLKLLDAQAARGWKGRIVTNPNCSTVVLAMALAPLRQFGLKTVMITTLQAVSGAGYPGVRRWTSSATSSRSSAAKRRRSRPRRRRSSACLTNGPRRSAPGRRQRHDDARAGAERAHRVDFGRVRADAAADAIIDGDGAFAAGRRSSSCRRRRRSRSSIWRRARTGRSRGSTSSATAA